MKSNEYRELLRLKRISLTKRQNFIREIDDLSVDIIKSKISILEPLVEEVSLISKGFIELLIFENDESLDEEYEKIDDYESSSREALSLARSRLEFLTNRGKRSASNSSSNDSLHNLQHSNSPSVSKIIHARLPKLEIAKFDGDILSFTNFFESFKSAVDDNTSLSDIDKLNYLLSFLTGSAKDVLKGLRKSGDCYHEALEIITKRFGNKNKIIRSHIQCLINLPMLDNVKLNIRSFVNNIESHVRSLKGFSVMPEQYGIFLVQIILNRMQLELRQKWAKLDVSEDGDLSMLIDFLHTEANILEYSSDSSFNFATSKKQNYQQQVSSLVNITQNASNYIKCLFCQSTEHFSNQCPQFISKSVEERSDIVKTKNLCFNCLKSHLVKNCESKYRCKYCKGRHNTMLHVDKASTNLIKSNSRCFVTSNKSEIVLGTALLCVKNFENVKIRVLFDSGSQVSLICSRKLKDITAETLPFTPLRIMGVSGVSSFLARRKVRFQIGLNTKFVDVDVFECENICERFSPVNINPDIAQNIKQFKLSDDISISREIDMLIGADHFFKFLTGKVELIKPSLAAVETVFGTWSIIGDVNVLSGVTQTQNDDMNLTADQVNHFLGAEFSEKELEFNAKSIDKFCKDNIKRVKDRYSVNFPWKDKNALSESCKSQTFSRFNFLISRLSRDPNILSSYHETFRSYLTSNFIEEANDNKLPIRYLPHRPIIKTSSDTTKIRPVFDASAIDSKSRSLNDYIDKGPNMLASIYDMLLCFRKNKKAIVGDIKQAFLQIEIEPEDRNVTRFFWYDLEKDFSSNSKILTYRFKRLLFGLNASPFILTAVMKKHIRAYTAKFPKITQILLKSIYMDDLVSSLPESVDISRFVEIVKEIFSSAGMEMCKFNSNDPSFAPNEAVKVLGVEWSPSDDLISAKITQIPLGIRSKRELLRFIASVWDPYGLLVPLLVNPKLAMQEAWCHNLSWDEDLPSNLSSSLTNWLTEIKKKQEICIPRWINYCGSSACNYEYHVFADASKRAMAAVIYLRTVNSFGVNVTFIKGKMRMAPKAKPVSLPRLELNSLVMATKLISEIRKSLLISAKTYCYSDSKVSLAWIHGDPLNWNLYIGNRVRVIKENSDIVFSFIPGNLNPADVGTRDFTKNDSKRSLWHEGPDFLKEKCLQTFQLKVEEVKDLNDFRKEEKSIKSDIVQITTVDEFLDLARYSSLVIVQRVTCYMLRARDFYYHLPHPLKQLSLNEFSRANIYLLRLEQNLYFSDEIKSLMIKGKIDSSSKLLKFMPFIDDDGLVRMTGRLRNSILPYNEKFPVILPSSGNLTRLIVINEHEKGLHLSARDTLFQLRCHYWILKGLKSVKSIIYQNCMHCRRYRAEGYTEVIAPLPEERVDLVFIRPFVHAGLDFFGPINLVRSTKASSTKTYVLLFTCLQTRAIHLEPVTSMSAETTLLAIQRFFGRRGISSTFKSDNAKTFKALSPILLKNYYCDWSFITERAPWHGGAWERMVRSVKIPLKDTLRNKHVSFEEFSTLLCRIEAIVNSRPLIALLEDPDSPKPISPSNFIIGSSLLQITKQKNTCISYEKELIHREKILKYFFERWRKEYLSFLMIGSKQQRNRKISVGDVILVKNDKGRDLWPLGIVHKLHVGTDSLVRTVTVKVNGKLIRRPIQNLYFLEHSSLGGSV